jgi:hypothetical protein
VVAKQREIEFYAHRPMRLLCALEAEGSSALAGNVQWFIAYICLGLDSIFTACTTSQGDSACPPPEVAGQEDIDRSMHASSMINQEVNNLK